MKVNGDGGCQLLTFCLLCALEDKVSSGSKQIVCISLRPHFHFKVTYPFNFALGLPSCPKEEVNAVRVNLAGQVNESVQERCDILAALHRSYLSLCVFLYMQQCFFIIMCQRAIAWL